jgi:hypothetical protein
MLPVRKTTIPAFFVVAVLASLFAGHAGAGIQMPVGFFDDPSFRWSPDRADNLQRAAAAGASIIHTTATWPSIAPTRPADPTDGSDAAYHLNDLDDLVAQASRDGLRVMIDINGTPKWANGNKTPNHLPSRLADLTAFARMLATRYNGYNGHGSVSLYSVWNEPNLDLFLTPQFVGNRIVGPANYVKLYKAAYAGIKAGNPRARVAIGETSARGRDKPLAGVSGSVAPATFARLVAAQKGLKFDAWAHHPYPTGPNLPPLQKVRYPNVTLGSLPQFEGDLKKWFHRTVPVWITEYGHETKPGEPHGVSTATQANYATQALQIARKDPNVQMFIWFTFRDSSGNPWQSGLLGPSGAAKLAYGAFGALARIIDGETMTVTAGSSPVVKLYFPTLFYYQGTGVAGMTWTVRSGTSVVAAGQPVVPFAGDESLTIPLTGFKPLKKHTYALTVSANESGGHNETETATLVAG